MHLRKDFQTQSAGGILQKDVQKNFTIFTGKHLQSQPFFTGTFSAGSTSYILNLNLQFDGEFFKDSEAHLEPVDLFYKNS